MKNSNIRSTSGLGSRIQADGGDAFSTGARWAQYSVPLGPKWVDMLRSHGWKGHEQWVEVQPDLARAMAPVGHGPWADVTPQGRCVKAWVYHLTPHTHYKAYDLGPLPTN